MPSCARCWRARCTSARTSSTRVRDVRAYSARLAEIAMADIVVPAADAGGTSRVAFATAPEPGRRARRRQLPARHLEDLRGLPHAGPQRGHGDGQVVPARRSRDPAVPALPGGAGRRPRPRVAGSGAEAGSPASTRWASTPATRQSRWSRRGATRSSRRAGWTSVLRGIHPSMRGVGAKRAGSARRIRGGSRNPARARSARARSTAAL